MKDFINLGYARCINDTPNRPGKKGAVKCRYLDDLSTIWIPKSQLDPDGSIHRTGDAGDLWVNGWWVDKEDLEPHVSKADQWQQERRPDPDLNNWAPLKKMYRRIIAKYHPDRWESDDEVMVITPTEVTKDINELWQEFQKVLKGLK